MSIYGPRAGSGIYGTGYAPLAPPAMQLGAGLASKAQLDSDLPPTELPEEPADDPSLFKRASDAGLGGLSMFGNALDLPGSMLRDVMTWLPGGIDARNPFDQVLSPFSDKNRTTGEEILQNAGVFSDQPAQSTLGSVGRFLGGTALEIGLDPLTYATLGILPALGKAGRLGKAAGLIDDATKVAGKKLGTEVGKRRAYQAVTPRELAANFDEAGGGTEGVEKLLDAFNGMNAKAIKQGKQARATSLDEIPAELLDSPLGGNFRVKFPFMDEKIINDIALPGAVTGAIGKAGDILGSIPLPRTGGKTLGDLVPEGLSLPEGGRIPGEVIAGAGDAIAEKIRYGKYSPIPMLAPIFSKPLRSTRTKTGNEAATEITRNMEDQSTVVRDEMMPHLEAFDDAGYFKSSNVASPADKAADELLASVDSGGVPAIKTNSLKQIAAELGIEDQGSWSAADLVSEIRKVRAAAPVSNSSALRNSNAMLDVLERVPGAQLPEELMGAEPSLNRFRELYDEQIAEMQRAGSNIEELGDVLKYTDEAGEEQSLAMPFAYAFRNRQTDTGPMWRAMNSGSRLLTQDGGAMQRQSGFRHVPTSEIQTMSVDTDFAGIHDKGVMGRRGKLKDFFQGDPDTGVMGSTPEDPKAVEELYKKFRDKYNPFKYFDEANLDPGAKRALESEHRKLFDSIRHLNREQAEKGVPMFDINLAGSALKRLESGYMSMASTVGARGLLSKNARVRQGNPTMELGEQRNRVAQLARNTFGEESEKVLPVMEARARTWAKETGRKADEWFAQIEDIRKGDLADVGGDSLYQWHGSPGRFSKFTLDHMRSGEGEHAFGWGLYFADSKDVGKFYKDTLSKKKGTEGALYDVALAPANDEYLLWHKPLREQSDKVKASLQELGLDPDDLDGHLTGDEIYQKFASDHSMRNPMKGDPQEAASKLLQSKGVRGIKYPDAKSEGHNYVIFDDADVQIRDVQYQDATRGPKGAVEFVAENKAIITAFEDADLSTLVHETAHIFRRDLPEELLSKAADAVGLPKGQPWSREAEEAFATGFEKYMKTGKVDKPGLKGVYEKFKEWLGSIYRSITGTQNVDERLRKVFDSALGKDDTSGAFNLGDQLEAMGLNYDRGKSKLVEELGAPAEQIKAQINESRRSEAKDALLKTFLDESGLGPDDGIDDFTASIREIIDNNPDDVPDLIKQISDPARQKKAEAAFKGLKYEATPDDILKEFEIDKHLGADVARLNRKFSSPEETSAVVAAFDAVTNLFKGNVTAPFPSFHARNLMSGFVQNMLNDVSDPRYSGAKQYVQPYKDTLQILKGKTLADADEIPAFARRGLTPEQATEEIKRYVFSRKLVDSPGMHNDIVADLGGSVVDQILGRKSFKDRVKRPEGATLLQTLNPLNSPGVRGNKPVFAPVRWGRAAGDVSEQVLRTTPFVALLRQGFDPDEAARMVDRLQVNYSDLTDVERKVLRRAVPFYSFNKGATKYLATELAQKPGGKVAMSIKAAENASGNDPGTPEYIRDGLNIPLGENEDGSRHYLTGAGLMHEPPMQLLGPSIPDTLFNAAGMLHPAIKLPVELLTNESLFMEGPGGGGRSLDDLDPLLGRTLANVGNTLGLTDREAAYRLPGGKMLEATIANSPAARYLHQVRKATDSRKGIGTRLVDNLTGFKIATVDQKARDAVLREQLETLMRGMGGRTFSQAYLPDEVMASLEGDELARAQAIQAALKMINANRRKANKADGLPN